jgi:fatty-acid desaturase
MTIILITLLFTHLTIVSVTLYLHRSQAHRGVEFHPVLSHAMRFWLWLTTGMRIGGEELHNNHHADIANPKFSRKWFEFDIGWFYIRILSMLGLAKVRTS